MEEKRSFSKKESLDKIGDFDRDINEAAEDIVSILMSSSGGNKGRRDETVEKVRKKLTKLHDQNRKKYFRHRKDELDEKYISVSQYSALGTQMEGSEDMFKECESSPMEVDEDRDGRGEYKKRPIHELTKRSRRPRLNTYLEMIR